MLILNETKEEEKKQLLTRFQEHVTLSKCVTLLTVDTTLRIATTLDMLVIVKNNQETLIEIKTSNNINIKIAFIREFAQSC